MSDATELVYSLSRISWLGGWWGWAVAILALALVLTFVIRLYRRDTTELARSTRVALMLLRVGVIVGLVFFFLGLERRARQRVTRPSEVPVLIDTSQSMSLPQSDQPGDRTRIEAATDLIAQTPMLNTLADNHRVTLYTFDATGELNEVLVSGTPGAAEDSNTDADDEAADNEVADNEAAGADSTSLAIRDRPTRSLAIVGVVGLTASVLLMLIAGLFGIVRRGTGVPPLLLAAAVSMMISGVVLGISWTVNTDITLFGLLGLSDATATIRASETNTPESESEQAERETLQQKIDRTDWQSILVAAGGETRIGDALRGVSTRHDPTTLAGVVVLTDGENNGGTPPEAAAALIARGGTAIYPIGFGSAKPPTNVRIVDLDAPRRVYPGDKFRLNAVLQASGSGPVTVQVQLLDAIDSTYTNADTTDASASTDDEESPAGELVDSREVTIPGDGTLLGVAFEMEPTSVGRRRLTIRVVPPTDDQNEKDNVRLARYEVVSKRLRVLLLAGGPMREYRFVRNLLYRDPSVEVDVLLQTGQAGMSQDADRLLTDFPATAEALFDYDAIVAFDPDWLVLDANQIELLDQWISRQAGGLALISGPVYMPQWMRVRTDPRVEIVRRLYPVALSSRGPLLSTGRTGGDTAWPLEFAPDAGRADFLELGTDAETGSRGWADFGGVYDFVGVNEAKPGARIYAYFSDPSTAIDEALPIYLASQFYGAGRVFFQGSGEMWRLRGVSDALFDAFYTKLVRWISEGRLLRDSNRGLLLVDRPRAMVGDTITVRAILTDQQFQPLRVPQVEAKLLTPSGRTESVRLTPLAGEPREGTYSARIFAREAGAYEIRVTLGTALNEEVLRQSFQIGLPTLELERPRRNDDVLRAIAASTGGQYVTMDMLGSDNQTTPLQLVASIEPQPQLTILPGTPDRDFERRRNAALMWLLCSMLTMEWVVRRLHRLA